jgi:formylglycine-generating enzyme
MHHTQTFKDNPFTFTMRYVEGGTFSMGSTDDDKDAFADEKPLREKVAIAPFYMGEYLVTQQLWAIVMQDTGMAESSYFKGGNRPVERVSWEDITNVFLPKLNEMTKDLREKGSFYRLPTEAEWEYAAKGGQYYAEFPFTYSGSNKLNEVGWYDENGHGETKPVGLKSPNFLGIHDMSGNVFEWCHDVYGDYEAVIEQSEKDAETGALLNPTGVAEGSNRVVRGGPWNDTARYCRSAFRYDSAPSYRSFLIGFRLVCVLPSVR